MATRKIKDAQDTTTNELIYFKGHAKATYMSDGRNVEDAIHQIGTGGGGVVVETDPIFSASPAASITDENIAEWNNKVSYSDKDLRMVNADGFMTSDGDGFVFPNTPAAQEGQGFVLATLDDIPNEIPIETYLADFTMESLRTGMYNREQVECDMQALVAAMNANKIILVREGEDSSYKGVYVLNGYAEDLLYFSIVDSSGNILYCNGTNYGEPYIDGRDLYLQNWWEKQDTLVSGENIKTINGESILGSGNITIEGGGGSSGGGGVETIMLMGGVGVPLILEEMLAEKRYWLYVDGDLDGSDQSIVIGGFEGGYTDDEPRIRHFYAVIECYASSGTPFNVSLILPDVSVYWSTGTPIPIRGNGLYELSITQVIESGYAFYNAVLTPFKAI